MRNDLIIGLDIGSSFVRAVIGRQSTENKLEILSIGKSKTIGHIINGDIVNINKTSAAISEALKNIASTIEGKNNDYYFSSNISGSHINVNTFSITQARDNAMSPVSETELIQLINKAKKSNADKNPCILHTLPIGFQVDNLPETLEPIGQIGSKIKADFIVVTADQNKNDILKQCLISAQSEHLKTGNIYFSPLATASSVLNLDEKQLGVALVDIGSGTIEISVYTKNRLRHSKVINWGGDRITEDIQIGLNVSLEHAEVLKTKFGSALSKEIDINEVVLIPGIAGRKPTPISVKNLAIIIEERIKELAAIILVEISKVTDPLLLKGGIVITGGGAQLPDIADLIQKVTGLESRIGEPMAFASTAQIEAEIKDPSYATAVGLVQVYFEQVNQPEVEEEVSNPTLPQSPTIPSGPTAAKPKGPSFKDLLKKTVEVLIGSNEEEENYPDEK
ncbi:MAG: cell division protein FtsA [Aquirufa sp.]